MFKGPELLDGRYPKISGVKPLVDVISCPKWAFPAVQQVFGRSPKAFAEPYQCDIISLFASSFFFSPWIWRFGDWMWFNCCIDQLGEIILTPTGRWFAPPWSCVMRWCFEGNLEMEKPKKNGQIQWEILVLSEGNIINGDLVKIFRT